MMRSSPTYMPCCTSHRKPRQRKCATPTGPCFAATTQTRAPRQPRRGEANNEHEALTQIMDAYAGRGLPAPARERPSIVVGPLRGDPGQGGIFW